jgi:hypothetical protein
MSEKSRKTSIIAHCGRVKLIMSFPDRDDRKYTEFLDANGEKVGEAAGHPGKYSGESINLLAQFAVAAGYTYDLIVEERVDKSWINVNDNIYMVQRISDRKSSIQVTSTDTDEADHYAIVDSIVKELALKGIGTLDGECHITITTRC